MRRIKTSELVPGMITAEDVYTYNNQLILPKGLILNDRTITKLAYYSIFYVKVEDSPEHAPAHIPFESTYAERLKKNPEFKKFRKDFEADVDNFKSVINDVIEKGAPLNVDELMDHTLNILDLGTTTNLFDILHNMRDYDDATYAHSMNVALICNVFARWMRMNDDEIRLATMSGLLHDIGKTQIPDTIIKKPGKLTDDEYDLVKTHPQEGYRILQNTSLSQEVLNAVLMHHERCDGTGYPYGLTGERIGIYAKMVCIADVYDAMTSARIYRGPLCPFKAIALFESEGLQRYDPGLIMTFLENVVNTYLLNSVRLSNGLIGKIVFVHREKLSAPTIQTEHGFLDLSIHPDIAIEALV
ncbi:MAG: HD-GYP domain-containing protein [Lachnospiraceae bacterium]|nr:HD-GYP domain-containing protein [Lachnospiraceae bacterium]MDE6185013.1 HD-GYP domain-containing protein [Lachnospiraceae bacterium]